MIRCEIHESSPKVQKKKNQNKTTAHVPIIDRLFFARCISSTSSETVYETL